MYKKQLEELEKITAKVIFIDDCSPEPIKKSHHDCYRITDDMGNNGLGAKNLGFILADTKWVLSTDLDHTIPEETWKGILCKLPALDENKFYTFKRRKHGEEIHPHCNTILITKELFFKHGGYDLRYQGTRSGDHSLLDKLDKEELDLYIDTYGLDDYSDAMTKVGERGSIDENEPTKPIINFKFERI